MAEHGQAYIYIHGRKTPGSAQARPLRLLGRPWRLWPARGSLGAQPLSLVLELAASDVADLADLAVLCPRAPWPVPLQPELHEKLALALALALALTRRSCRRSFAWVTPSSKQ
jgi:hypothetical protein